MLAGGLWLPAYGLLGGLALNVIPPEWQAITTVLSLPTLLLLPMILIGLSYTHTFPGETWAPRRWGMYQGRVGLIVIAAAVIYILVVAYG